MHYKLYGEIAIVSYYIDKKIEGYQACDYVTFSDKVSEFHKNSALNNQAFYMRKIPFKKTITIDCELPQDYIGSSSSLIPYNDGFLLNLRCVNYSINDLGGYIVRDTQGIVRTKNYLLTLDQNLNTINSIELIDKSNIPLYPVNIKGMEDIRLFGHDELFCTYLEVNSSRIPQMCYCKYNPKTGDIISVYPLMVNEELKCEKNWMPFIMNNEVHFIYTVQPFRLYKLNGEHPELIKDTNLLKLNIDTFRGSSGLILYNNGWLATIHQVYHNNPRKYFHRFIWFDNSFTNLKFSEIFYFESPAIEFNLSICHSKLGLLVTYSHNDNSSKIGIFNYNILDLWLKL